MVTETQVKLTKATFDPVSSCWRDSHGTVIDFSPVNPTTIRRNEFSVAKTFPFRSFSQLPTLSTALDEVILSTSSVVVSCAGLVLNLAVFLPLGLVRSLGNVLGLGRRRAVPGTKRCVILTGASSGIGASLVHEYALPGTHMVLIARDETRLSILAKEAEDHGATAEIHMLNFYDEDAMSRLKEIVFKVDREQDGIDIALSVSSVVGHQADVLGRKSELPERVSNSIAENIRPAIEDMENGTLFGSKTAERTLRVNVEASQTFVMTIWETMKSRPQQNLRKIVIMASSAAWFGPANFMLYSSSKAYLYQFAQSLRVLSQPFGIQVTTICPGFIETGMTSDMMAAGSTTPKFVYADSRKLAKGIRQAEEGGQAVYTWPLVQTAFLFGCKGLTPLGEAFGMWFSYATGIASWVMS